MPVELDLEARSPAPADPGGPARRAAAPGQASGAVLPVQRKLNVPGPRAARGRKAGSCSSQFSSGALPFSNRFLLATAPPARLTGCCDVQCFWG